MGALRPRPYELALQAAQGSLRGGFRTASNAWDVAQVLRKALGINLPLVSMPCFMLVGVPVAASKVPGLVVSSQARRLRPVASTFAKPVRHGGNQVGHTWLNGNLESSQ